MDYQNLTGYDCYSVNCELDYQNWSKNDIAFALIKMIAVQKKGKMKRKNKKGKKTKKIMTRSLWQNEKQKRKNKITRSLW